MGIFDQLSQLDQSPTPETSTVGPSEPSKTVKTASKAQSPILTSKRPPKKPTLQRKASSRDASIATANVTSARETPRELSSDTPSAKSRELPTREEIQEFSFRLRDDLKVKVQAEVPHQWQDELEDMARALDVKKLELYRYILGEFLGKVQRKHKP